jgi:hypothetical protein
MAIEWLIELDETCWGVADKVKPAKNRRVPRLYDDKREAAVTRLLGSGARSRTSLLRRVQDF